MNARTRSASAAARTEAWARSARAGDGGGNGPVGRPGSGSPLQQINDEGSDVMGWQQQAACRGHDPELFFPTATSGPVFEAQVTAAKAVCAECPVRAECLVEALERVPYGIAGGLTEDERRRTRRATRTTATSPPSVARQLLAEGRPAREVASRCEVSERTAQRWVARARAEVRTAADAPAGVAS